MQTQYSPTNHDKTDCLISNSRITFGVFSLNHVKPKVPKNAPNRQNGRVFENLGRLDNRILSETPLPQISLKAFFKLGLEDDSMFDDATELSICEEYRMGASIRILSRKYLASVGTIFNILEKHKIRRRTLSESHRVYQADHYHFHVIDTFGKEYFLGFIMADGHLGQKNSKGSAELQVRLAALDRGHLWKLLEEVKSNHPIHDHSGKYPSCSIKIRSNKLVEDLHRHGVHYPHEQVRFPDISPSLSNHFIRGVWDGDGMLFRDKRGIWEWFICGDEPLLVAIQDTLMKECHVGRTKISRDSKGNTYNLVYHGNLQVPRIIEWMYKGADPSIWLDRKRVKAMEMFADLKARSAGPYGSWRVGSRSGSRNEER